MIAIDRFNYGRVATRDGHHGRPAPQRWLMRFPNTAPITATRLPILYLNLLSVPRISLSMFSRCANTINAAPAIAALIIGARFSIGRITHAAVTQTMNSNRRRIEPSEVTSQRHYTTTPAPPSRPQSAPASEHTDPVATPLPPRTAAKPENVSKDHSNRRRCDPPIDIFRRTRVSNQNVFAQLFRPKLVVKDLCV